MRALLLLALTCARAEINISEDGNLNKLPFGRRNVDVTGGCMYSGRWWSEGASVAVRDACLRCRCAHGALSCARAACAPVPDPAPRRCALLHRRDTCCPELHCPDGVRSLELSAAARFELESESVVMPASPGHACVEEGAVFAAGSALSARAACEHCFCLRGARRCVRPRCLPPPPGCAPRPASGACCPQRYYCDHNLQNPTTSTTSVPLIVHHRHDCQINGEWVSEGERLSSSAAGGGNCSQCFCLRGEQRCEPLACAPALRGCTPLLRAGQCCPYQYRCPHQHTGLRLPHVPAISDNALILTRNDDRSFRTSASTKLAITTKTSLSELPARSRSAAPPLTTKVKRKTDDALEATDSQRITQGSTEATRRSTTSTELPSTTLSFSSTSMTTLSPNQTEQPESSVRIIINGTINCTAELSSGITNASTTTNSTVNIDRDAQAREPELTEATEVRTSSPADIITERSEFDEHDSFTVNVSSSLRANTSHSAIAPPPLPPVVAAADDTPSSANISRAKDDYDYDYNEPTLPPSLPNLKIIPFVAADAVVDEDSSSKEESVPYPALEREDKFPVYYPSPVRGDAVLADRRQDVLTPTHYPVFVSERVQPGVYSELLAAETSKAATKPPAATTASHRDLPTPSVNLFSPPVETEGGFVPKGPGIIDEYYAVYPSTPPPVPHLTTSMQINPNTPEAACITDDGERVAEGESVQVGCSVCTCEWGDLRCGPVRCRTPSHCRRRALAAAATPSVTPIAATTITAAALDLCCGDLICDQGNVTTAASTLSTPPEVSTSPELLSDLIPFDPPPDRSVPSPALTTVSTAKPNKLEQSLISNATGTTAGPIPSASTTESVIFDSIYKQATVLPAKIDSSSVATLASVQPSSSIASTPTLNLTQSSKQNNATTHQSQEYEDEDDDEGFSFGSVLKLLLSDSYDTTPSTTTKRKPMSPTTTSSPAPPPSSTRRLPPRPSVAAAIPSYPYIPPKKVFLPNTVNRIDHLVLGEATAIRKSTPPPPPASTGAPFRPVNLPPKKLSTRPSTRIPELTTRTAAPPPKTEEVTARPGVVGGGGLFKLAGCNIYGRMYRVGRIIAELSTPCQECRCTELGVQCSPLRC